MRLHFVVERCSRNVRNSGRATREAVDDRVLDTADAGVAVGGRGIESVPCRLWMVGITGALALGHLLNGYRRRVESLAEDDDHGPVPSLSTRVRTWRAWGLYPEESEPAASRPVIK